MRGYAKVSPCFWTGATGRALRELGAPAQLVALYLMSCPSANRLGLYYLPLPTAAHELGKPCSTKLTHYLRQLEAAAFAEYDNTTEFVWVYKMAVWQNTDGEPLKKSDNRCSGVRKTYKALPPNPFLGPFFDTYSDIFHMDERRGAEGDPLEGLARGSEGALVRIA